MLYDTNESFRNLLLYSLTKNQASTHQQIDHKVGEVGNIFIGQADIHRIHPDSTIYYIYFRAFQTNRCHIK